MSPQWFWEDFPCPPKKRGSYTSDSEAGSGHSQGACASEALG